MRKNKRTDPRRICSRQRTRVVIAILPCLALFVGGCSLFDAGGASGGAQARKTVDGTEDPRVLQGLSGTIAMNDPTSDQQTIEVVSLPGLQRKVLPLANHIVQCLSGPDDRGRIAYIQQEYQSDGMWDRGILPQRWLRIVALHDGEDVVLFQERRYCPYSYVALSSNSGLLAVVTSKEDFGHQNEHTFLDVWDLATGKRTARPEGLCDPNAPRWFADGQRLAFEVWMEPEECPARIQLSDPSHPHDSEGRVAVVCVWDAQTGEIRMLQAGLNPIPATDGRSLYVNWYDGLVRIDATTGEILNRHLWAPGRLSIETHLVSALPGELILYPARSTTGTKLELIPPKMWPKWTIKVADPVSGAFATAVANLTQRNVSYGPTCFDLGSQSK